MKMELAAEHNESLRKHIRNLSTGGNVGEVLPRISGELEVQVEEKPNVDIL